MASNTRLIKRRIKSIGNTKKITKAMELVAASKMRRATEAVLGTRPYARLAWNMVDSIQKKIDTATHPLLYQPKEKKNLLVVFFASDRGLAGGFNSNIIKKVSLQLQESDKEGKIDLICIGKKGARAMKKTGKNILATFSDLTNNPKFQDVLPISRLIQEEFIKKTYDHVLMGYTDFVSAISQTPVLLELLPFSKTNDKPEPEQHREYLFEPNPQNVLNQMLPRLIDTMVYQALLESAASEHSARMMSMHNASDAAADMIENLSFTYNQARQAGITQEIAEISSGKAALERTN